MAWRTVAPLMVLALAHSASGVTLSLHLFNESTHPNARCNDGTMSGYYFHAGSSTNTWIIQQQGGGWCFDERSCKDRLNTPDLVSSKEWKEQITISDGVFNSSDPRLHMANMVYVQYCTSDAYIGNTSETSFGFQFRGRAVVDAVFSSLIHAHGLGSSPDTTVIYSGCSAGARGALFNTNHVATAFFSQNPNISFYGALLDSAFWIDLAPITPSLISFAEEAKRVYALMNVETTADPACIASFPGEGWQCIFGQYAVPHIRTPYLLHAYSYDAYQLSGDLGIPFGSKLQTPAQRAYASGFHNATATTARADIQPSSRQRGLLPACYSHCATEDARWWQVRVQSGAGLVSLDDAVSSWYRGTGAVPYLYQDSCTGFNCGRGCPA
eukprot:m.257700 g.257700  ORF g.257700 m.257700 type:complete len:383 (-) comp21013_c0_seq1:57-1205(-)